MSDSHVEDPRVNQPPQCAKVEAMSSHGERPYRGIRADQRRSARRNALIEAGLDIIGEKGWPALSLKGVCERAGLTERYFYESFAKLDAFRAALVDQVADETAAAIVNAIDSSGTDPRAALRAIVNAVWQLLLEDPRRGRVAAMEGIGDPTLLGRRESIEARFEDVLTTRSADVFGLDPADPATPVLSAAFVGAADEIFQRLLGGQLTEEPSVCSELLISVFSHGVPQAISQDAQPNHAQTASRSRGVTRRRP
jgi:AcrR family transcriptional regulator